MMNSRFWMVVPFISVLNVDHSKDIFNDVGISLPNDVTPLIVLEFVNSWVFSTYRRQWETMANQPIQPLLYNPGFCFTSGCSNAAFAYVLCNAYCRTRHGVEVRETRRNGGVGLGLFACREFPANSFVVVLSWFTNPGHVCNTSTLLEILTPSKQTKHLELRHGGRGKVSFRR